MFNLNIVIMRMNFTKLLALLIAVGTSLSASAADFEADGISYEITSTDENLVSVTEGSYEGAITIPSTVTYNATTYTVTGIGSYTFFYCDITSVEMPATIESIGAYAFYGCKGITGITIPDNVATIGNNAFGQCWNLESVNIPAAVTNISSMAFDNCYSLKEIYCLPATPPSCSETSFSRVETSTCTLYIPEGAKEAYNIAPWYTFGTIVETDFAGTEEIASETESGAEIYGAGGRIIIAGAPAGTQVAIYTANGTIFYNGTAADIDMEISVPAGIYIVKCGSKVEKVLI